ncbi:CPBP family intramembrane glutamic endopeptidase [Streptococcus dentasini]
MTKDNKMIEPQPKLIWPYLVWTFGWTWGWWGVIFLFDNSPFAQIGRLLWPFGPAIGATIVLKISLKTIPKWLFSGKKGTWLYLLLFSGLLTVVSSLAVSGRLAMEALPSLPLMAILLTLVGGGNEEPGWRGFLQPALEKKFSFPLATVILGIIWGIWHLPLWVIDRGGSLSNFIIQLLGCILIAFAYAGLYKATHSIIACCLFHTVSNLHFLVFEGLTSDYSQASNWYYMAGLLLVAGCGVWLWYRTDKKEKTCGETM